MSHCLPSVITDSPSKSPLDLGDLSTSCTNPRGHIVVFGHREDIHCTELWGWSEVHILLVIALASSKALSPDLLLV